MRILFAALIALTATTAQAQVVTYNIFIDGDDSSVQMLAPGTYELRVEVIVTDNDITGSGNDGGILQSAFDLTDTANAIVWEDVIGGFLGGSNGLWDSTPHATFDTTFAATLADGDTDAIAETGSIANGNYNDEFGTIGANFFSVVATGNFTYDGSETFLNLTVANPILDVLVAALSGGVVAASANTVNGDSIQLTAIPEPATLLLAGMGLIGIVSLRRRSIC